MTVFAMNYLYSHSEYYLLSLYYYAEETFIVLRTEHSG